MFLVKLVFFAVTSQGRLRLLYQLQDVGILVEEGVDLLNELFEGLTKLWCVGVPMETQFRQAIGTSEGVVARQAFLGVAAHKQDGLLV